jgi:inhibitor of KinA
MIFPRIYSLGDNAVTVEFGNQINETINNQCIAFTGSLTEQNFRWLKDIIPAYTTVTLIYDTISTKRIAKNETAFSFVRETINKMIKNIQPATALSMRKITVPVCYHESLAPDLNEFAATKNCSIQQIIELHTSKTYRVYLLGFLPGFPYMGTVDPLLNMPRKKTPHLKIAAGSVGIAGLQTGIYPLDSPGGWNIIGQTPLQLFDPAKTGPVFFHPGDEVQFECITLESFHQQKKCS